MSASPAAIHTHVLHRASLVIYLLCILPSLVALRRSARPCACLGPRRTRAAPAQRDQVPSLYILCTSTASSSVCTVGTRIGVLKSLIVPPSDSSGARDP
ncbi:hypothetical protein FKP32DRAFT_530219 [Trametes sanguinea]|nr:hypothetical protein FKP32DRAFT_530219 [Trametes sanguinea]